MWLVFQTGTEGHWGFPKQLGTCGGFLLLAQSRPAQPASPRIETGDLGVTYFYTIPLYTDTVLPNPLISLDWHELCIT